MSKRRKIFVNKGSSLNIPKNTPLKKITTGKSRDVFGEPAKDYAENFTLSIGYEVSEKATAERMASYLEELYKRGISCPTILEVGAGTGQSTMRIQKLLEQE